MLDGQHRLHAMKMLARMQPAYKVVVEVLREPPDETLSGMWRRITNQVEVPEQRRLLKERVVEMFVIKYGQYASTASKRPARRPHVKLDDLWSELFCRSPVPDLIRDPVRMLRFIEYASERLGDAHPDVRLLADPKAKKGCSALYLSADPSFEWARTTAWAHDFLEAGDLLAL